ncbi:MAG: 50S ribosomal protein L40e [Candidatus Nezhaarchaeales archaeon]
MPITDPEKQRIVQQRLLFVKICRKCNARNPPSATKCRRCRSHNLRWKRRVLKR